MLVRVLFRFNYTSWAVVEITKSEDRPLVLQIVERGIDVDHDHVIEKEGIGTGVDLEVVHQGTTDHLIEIATETVEGDLIEIDLKEAARLEITHQVAMENLLILQIFWLVVL